METCIVMDVGTGSIKAEYHTAEKPQVFHNVVGTLKQKLSIPQQELEGLVDGNTLVSEDVYKHRGLLKLGYPMQNGHVTDWAAMTRVFQYTEDKLGVPKREHPILVTEAANTSRPQRYKMAQILLEELQHPALLFSVQAVLSLYSTGSTTGVVLDVGDGVTHVVPVYEGYSVREAVRRIDFGGRDVTTHLQYLLRQHGHFFETSAELDIVREIKELRCHVASYAPKTVDGSDVTAAKTKHRLPDGTEIQLGVEQALAPEVLFNPSLCGKEYSGVVHLVSESVKKTDMDVRRRLYENIFLSGGSTLFQNFCTRFLSDITRLTPRDCKVRITAPAERMYTTWIGGSFLAGLTSFKQMLVTKAQYEEEGERIIHAKLFC